MTARTRVRTLTADLLRLQPASGTRWVAARTGATVVTSLLLLWAVGRLEWGVYTTFGAFACVYGGSTAFVGRWRTQLGAGVVLAAAVTSGAAVAVSEHRAWLAVPVVALWAGLAAHLGDRARVVPPGALFAVFASGAAAARPADAGEVPVALLAALATALLGVALGVLEERRRGVPREEGHGRPRIPVNPERMALHAARTTVAAALAGSVATAVGIGHPYWAMVAAVVPLTTPGLGHQLTRGVHRAVGTLVGLLLALALLSLPLSPLVVIALAGVLQAATELLVVRNYAAAMVFITPLALLLGNLERRPDAASQVADRGVETLLGLAVGAAVAVLTRERAVAAAPALEDEGRADGHSDGADAGGAVPPPAGPDDPRP